MGRDPSNKVRQTHSLNFTQLQNTRGLEQRPHGISNMCSSCVAAKPLTFIREDWAAETGHIYPWCLPRQKNGTYSSSSYSRSLCSLLAFSSYFIYLLQLFRLNLFLKAVCNPAQSATHHSEFYDVSQDRCVMQHGVCGRLSTQNYSFRMLAVSVREPLPLPSIGSNWTPTATELTITPRVAPLDAVYTVWIGAGGLMSGRKRLGGHRFCFLANWQTDCAK
jgi:hypothetical protein